MQDTRALIQKPCGKDLFTWPSDLPKFLAPLFDPDLDLWDALTESLEFFKSAVKEMAPSFAQTAKISKQVELIHPELIWIEKGATIGPFVQIEGPAYIGKNVHIGHGALIRPHTVLCEGSKVGHASEVKASIFLPHAKAPHFNYVGNSLLGSDVNLGAGAILSNLRLDGGLIHCRYKGQRFSTSHTKLGAILADGVQIGCNVVLNPGTIYEKGTIIAPAKPRRLPNS